MQSFKYWRYTFGIILILQNVSCTKSWLDLKSDKSLVVPTTLNDFQAILDNDIEMNEGYPIIGDVGSDDYYLNDDIWQVTLNPFKDIYVWDRSALLQGGITTWQLPYKTVFYANAVLEGIEKVDETPENRIIRDNISGSALFYRAYTYFTLSQVFSEPYDPNNNSNLGIVIRTSTDVNSKSERVTVHQSYDLIIQDLKNAAILLPVTPAHKLRPSKPAAYGLLARVFLIMGDYTSALNYADSCLNLFSMLIDYNSLDYSSAFPIPFLNDEVIFQGTQFSGLFANNNNYLVDTLLYNSYGLTDLRRQAYFKESALGYHFIGSYMGSGLYSGNAFGGIAADEIYLIRAECYARNGDISLAMDNLNALLERRWVNGTFIPYTASDETDALSKILIERRKELLFRGVRWSDLRRLNKDSRFAKTLQRNVNGQTYTLLPNDLRYTYQIPQEVIDITGIAQNE